MLCYIQSMRDFLLVSKCMVYVARNKINGKRYIGATDRGIGYRASRHKWNANHGQKSKFYTAIRKYGFDAFEFLPLRACTDFFDALEHEAMFIANLRPEYNLTAGGGGVKGLKFSAESRAKMSAAKMGKPNHWSNGAMPQELRVKLSAKQKARRGYPLTDRQKASIEKNRLLGNAARRRKVICINDGIEYDSVTHAARAYGLTTGQVSWYCSGNHDGWRGLDFKYVDESDGQ